MTSPPVEPRQSPSAEVIYATSSRGRVWAAATAVCVLVAGALGTILLLLGLGAADVPARYEADAARALSGGDYQTARICFERLLQRNPNDPHLRLGLALSREGQQRLRSAAAPRTSD